MLDTWAIVCEIWFIVKFGSTATTRLVVPSFTRSTRGAYIKYIDALALMSIFGGLRQQFYGPTIPRMKRLSIIPASRFETFQNYIFMY